MAGRVPRLLYVLVIILIGAGAAVSSCAGGGTLTDHDAILVADFVNNTGDPVFDEGPRQVVAVQLQQSPFMTLLPDQRIQRTARMLQQAMDVSISGELAQAVCQRAGAKAFVGGTVTGSGSSFTVAIDAHDCATGATMATEQSDGADKAGLVASLGDAVTRLRRKLGEPADSIAAHDTPAETGLTTSLEALHAFGQGVRTRATQGDDLAIPLFQQATELDPDFALAYAKLAIVTDNTGRTDEAIAATNKAHDLRDRLTRYEQLYIDWNFATRVQRQPESVKQALVALTSAYPRDFAARNNFGVYYNNAGQLEEALQQYRAASEIAPDEPGPISNTAYVLMMLGRYDEAFEATDRALAIRPEPNLAVMRWISARIAGHPKAEEFASVARSIAGPDQMALAQSSLAAWFGQFKAFQTIQDGLMERARASGNPDLADGVGVGRLITLAAYRRGADLSALKTAAAREKNLVFLVQQVSALALLGELDATRAGLKRLAAQANGDESLLGPPMTVARAYVQAADGHAEDGIADLQAVLVANPRARDMHYFMANLYEQLGNTSAAVEHYRSMIDSLTYLGPNPLIPMSRLRLAKLLIKQGDPAGAQSQLDTLLKQWADADEPFPALTEAKQLRATLG